ncbi:MAG: carboxypeptidase-like regulatory domain-containing protein [Planctomycetaceae bacterium]
MMALFPTPVSSNSLGKRLPSRFRYMGLLILPLLLGCGEPKSTFLSVTGTAVRGDAPLVGATIYFTHAERQTVSWGLTDDSGAFRLEHSQGHVGAEPGKYKVWITFRPTTPAEEMQMAEGKFSPLIEHAEMLKQFGSLAATPLQVEVTPESTHFNLKFD